MAEADLSPLRAGIPLNPLPGLPQRDNTVPHAPARPIKFTSAERKLAIQNSLRYFPSELHSQLAREFAEELDQYGHIYMYRFRPIHYEMKAYPLSSYPAKLDAAKAIQLMIQNNLDPRVAQFPHELITYGGNGAVFSNWAQYHLTMKYLSEMTDHQTLVMYSGHPLGLFPSSPDNPRVVITNGMVIPNYSSKEDLERMYGLGVTLYGQMTAGSYCYIGPQGIVHGTTLTLLGAARKYLGNADLKGKVFVTSGLGGMSGAQAKAGVIAGCVVVIAEVSEHALRKRFNQGWVMKMTSDLEEAMSLIIESKARKEPISIGYHGNIVDLWERLLIETEKKGELIVELGSDQTSCHNPFNGGYYPVQLSFDESNRMMVEDPPQFKQLVQESLRRHVNAINKLTRHHHMKFWDYGNSFLLEASRAKADILDPSGKFIYPSYVEDIMGDIFSLGFGPFRWVCTSGNPQDLRLTDQVAADVCSELASHASHHNKQQYEDNLLWIQQAEEHALVVGSQARILYADAVGRRELASRFNQLVKEGKLSAPVVISRDHHDVSGTDSPFRETSNIRDGSMFTADMAVQNFCGLAMRGATWAALHNGGGTGWGEAINGGFGFVLDGTDQTQNRIHDMLLWDVLNGISRRAWSGNDNANWALQEAMNSEPLLNVTVSNKVDSDVLDSLL